jgi:LysM repeat protein
MTTNARSKTSPVSTLAQPIPSFHSGHSIQSAGRKGAHGHSGVSVLPAAQWWERPPGGSGSLPVSLVADRPSETLISWRGVDASEDTPRTGAPTRLASKRPDTPVSRCLALLGVTLAVLLGGFGIANASSSARSDARTYTVRPGDSFWSIARSVQPSGDLRPLVADLIEGHGTNVLQVGDRLTVPSA